MSSIRSFSVPPELWEKWLEHKFIHPEINLSKEIQTLITSIIEGTDDNEKKNNLIPPKFQIPPIAP